VWPERALGDNQAHRATLDAQLADTQQRRAAAAREASEAEAAAAEATKQRRAALEAEAVEALLDKSAPPLHNFIHFFLLIRSRPRKRAYILSWSLSRSFSFAVD